MQIGLDARLFHSKTGIGRYTRSLFFAYLQRPASDSVTLFYDRPLAQFWQRETEMSGLSAFPSHVKLVTALCPQRILWTNWHLPPLLRQHGIDVYHGVCNFELPVRKVCRYVVTIHDLIPLFFPKLVPWKHLLFFRLFMKRAAHTADVVITDSAHSARDLVQHLSVPAARIRVIYLGYDGAYQEVRDPAIKRATCARYGITPPYLLFVGVIEPKKNLSRLLTAFALLRQQRPDLQLVIAGGEGWGMTQLAQQAKAAGVEQHVIFPGFIPDADLPALYSGAAVFVFPSIYEGFGLPVLEAMSCGAPVVTSNVSSLPEIAGDAAVLVNPNEPSEICRGILAVLADEQKRCVMQAAGRLQAQKFSWARTAEETYRVYQEALAR